MFTRSIARLALALIIVCASLLLITSFISAPADAIASAHSPADLTVNPGESIQAAIDAANDGDTIIVNAGHYTESLTLSKPVSLTGVNSDTTIIHAMPGQRVLTVTGATITNSVVISGLTFTGGSATNATTCPDGCGGGLAIINAAQPTLQDLTMIDNQGNFLGGGIFADMGSPITLINASVISNAAHYGGGVGGYDITLLGGFFTHNTAYGGGGVECISATLIGGRFESNYAADRGGGLGIIGVQFSTLTMTGTKFLSNTAGSAGGGVSAEIEVDITAVNSRFENNRSLGLYSSGGGLYTHSRAVLIDTQFISNSARGAGGGVYTILGASVTNGRFERNTSNGDYPYGGGGLFDYGGELRLTDTQFLSNTANSNGGGLYANGLATITNSQFLHNSASSGGGMWTGGASLAGGRFEGNISANGIGGGLSTGPLTMSGTQFVSNTAMCGGGAFATSPVIIDGGRFERNTSNGSGGALCLSTLALTDTEFISNSATTNGGAIFYSYTAAAPIHNGRIVNALFSQNSATAGGAALFVQAKDNVALLHATIADTNPHMPSAIAVVSSTLNVTDTLIANHAIGISNTGGTVTEDYNLFYGNLTNTIGVITGAHSLIGDPRFVDPAHDDYHLAFGSAAIDRGVNAGVYTDLDGNLRPHGAGFDIGAYEFQGGTRYVATTGDDTSNLCLDQLSPCATVQHAIDVASEHDELRIASGTYTDMSVRPRNDITTTGVVTQVAYLSKTLTLRGGYTLTNWLTPDPVINQTILDAQAQGRVVYITGNISPTLDGLRLTHGNPRVALAVDECTDYWTCEADGGAIYVQTAALTLTNSRIDSNYFGRFDGGAVYVRIGHADLIHNEIVSNSNSGIMLANSTGFISGNVIFSNTTNGNGAGVLVKYSTARLVNNTILSNTADYVCGGGVCIAYGSAVLEGNLIRGNAFVRSGLGCGGGVDIFLSTATLKGNRIEDNTAYDEYGTGGGICIEASSQADLIGNVIRRNSTTGQGGGVYIGSQTHANLLGNTIVDNISGQGGGVGVNWLSSASLINNLVAHNPSASQLYVSGSQVDLLHTTLVDGSSTGLYVTSYQFNQEPPIFSTVALTNTLIASHTVGIDVSQGNTLTLNSLLWHGTPITISQTGTATIFVQNEFYGDPRFVDPAHDDYHLAFGSAAIDRGVDAGVYTDLDGHVRPIGPGFDIGAYESVAYRAFLPVMWR